MQQHVINLQEHNNRLQQKMEDLDEKQAQSITELVKSQVQVVISAPCIRLTVGTEVCHLQPDILSSPAYCKRTSVPSL